MSNESPPMQTAERLVQSSGLARLDAMLAGDGFTSPDPWEAKSFCFMIGPNLHKDDWHLFGCPVKGHKNGYIREFYKVLPDSATMWDVLVEAGVFKSKSEARKNWAGLAEIPWGWSEHKLSKRPTLIYIWKPSEAWPLGLAQDAEYTPPVEFMEQA